MTLAASTVACVYDIHGNFPALTAVLKALEESTVDIDLVVVGGDIAAGPLPRETLETLAELKWPSVSVQGNADAELLGTLDSVNGDVWDRRIAWIRGCLSEESLSALGALPLAVDAEVSGLGLVTFCHATPASPDRSRAT